MPSQIELQFYWRRQDIKEAIFAVTKAVEAGYDTKDRLLQALPQFSLNRIAMAIDSLISAGMAENNLGVLTIHPDMNIVFELFKTKLVLPVSSEHRKIPELRRLIISKLGCKNPAGVEALLHIQIPGG
ncbi:hypothetical protein [Pseudescherichia sp.]|uniref:hypothetical protein n=1 Tax=Pseudescherichia sp. TaxID=2055881 RepID=UPI0028A02D81|nr:hypothetical protein [Pseudescherichia sp.]